MVLRVFWSLVIGFCLRGVGYSFVVDRSSGCCFFLGRFLEEGFFKFGFEE